MDIVPFNAFAPAPGVDVRPIDAALFRAAFRKLAGGVSVVTVGVEGARSGFTATSVSSFSASPPTVVFSLGVSSSSYPLIERHRAVGVHLLGGAQQAVADAFAGRGGRSGEARYEGLTVVTAETGAPLLADAAVALDCRVADIIVRHDTALVLAEVVAIHNGTAESGLVYRDGGYSAVGPAHLDAPHAGLGDWPAASRGAASDPGVRSRARAWLRQINGWRGRLVQRGNGKDSTPEASRQASLTG